MKQNRLKIALQLFGIFFQIGAFTFGGGYAMIPLIQRETVERHRLIDQSDILDIVAIAESTPGPIAVNSATFIGYQAAGVWGSLAATLGVVLPSFFIILIVSAFLRQVMDYAVVRYAFAGIRAGVLSLVALALLKMARQCPKGVVPALLAVGAFLVSALTGCSVLLIIAAAAVIGLATYLLLPRQEETP